MTDTPDVAALRARVADAMQYAAEAELERQYRASDWEYAKDVAENLDVTAIICAALSAAPAVPRDVVVTDAMLDVGEQALRDWFCRTAPTARRDIARHMFNAMLAAAERGDAEGGA